MSASNHKEEQKKDVLVISLLDRRNSSFIMERSAEEGIPVALDAPGIKRLVPYYTLYDENGSPREVRYIKGAGSIYKDEQAGLTWNYLRDNIIINNGLLTVVKEGQNKALYEFLKNSPYNRDSPNFDPQSGIVPIFCELNKEEETVDVLKQAKQIKRALDICDELYTDNGDKILYDVERIEMLAKLFNVGGVETVAEKMTALMAIAQTRPQMFANSIADVTKEVLVTVRQAKSLGVILMDANSAIYADSKAKIMDLTGKNNAKKEEEMVDFLASKEGNTAYKQLMVAIDAAKAAQA